MTSSPRASRPAPSPVLDLCASRQLAIDQILERLIDPGHGLSTIAVLGEPGLGKSRAIQAFSAGASARGMAVVELKTGTDHREPFSTILSGFPELKPLLFDTAEDRSWARAVEAVAAERTDVGLLIVIDDAHTMDEESARFLTFFHRMSNRERSAGPFMAVAMATPKVDRLPSGLTRRLFKAQRTSYLELEPLHQSDLAELVAVVFADASAPVRRALTVELMDRSDGHPPVIDALIPLVNRSTYTIDLEPTPPLSAVEAVIEEANRSAGHGAYREAAEKLTSLHGVPGIKLTSATRTLHALSLYRIGAYPEAERIIGDLVDEALTADDHGAAFAAATLGLAEGEQHDGNPCRVEWLLRVNPDRLCDEDRVQHAVTTARQAVLVGRTGEAHRWWADADRLAKTSDERAAALSSGWYLTHHHIAPQDQCRRLRTILAEEDLSDHWRVKMQEHLCISLFEAGSVTEAGDLIGEVGRYASAAGDKLRTWHHLCFLTLLEFEKGHWDKAEECRIEAMTHAQKSVIGDGEHLYLGQKFNEAWVKNEQQIFAPVLRNLPPEIAGSWFGRVARVETLRAAGRIDEALEDGREIIRLSVEEPGHRVLPAMAYLSRFVAEVATEAERAAVFDLVAPRAGSLLLHGLGTATLGPTDRYLFHLSGDITHLHRAIEVADAAKAKLWQVLLRAEYAANAGGDNRLLIRQAERLAKGNDLTRLLDLFP